MLLLQSYNDLLLIALEWRRDYGGSRIKNALSRRQLAKSVDLRAEARTAPLAVVSG